MAQEQLGVGNAELRDWFAVEALNAILPPNLELKAGSVLDHERASDYARTAYLIADEMMAARSKT
jgi:hypothetical protein